jgi:hypothetical protein
MKIAKTEYRKMGEKTTICLIKLDNGFEIVGTSACVDPENYKKEIGEELAYNNAIKKLEEFEAYKTQEDEFSKPEVGHYKEILEKLEIIISKLPNFYQPIIYPTYPLTTTGTSEATTYTTIAK